MKHFHTVLLLVLASIVLIGHGGDAKPIASPMNPDVKGKGHSGEVYESPMEKQRRFEKEQKDKKKIEEEVRQWVELQKAKKLENQRMRGYGQTLQGPKDS